ncbi:diguanylate cyclase [Methylophaga sp. OBS4]|uniref:sensor domain-containing diguanylate cyclase n=1 Tax=Methylophaga sp. OBS4 TaxID=2991935 RepID=UPI0022575127|nr:diguanylate cyclase [Methylophaga sp. OBS4]MCX4186947.1 diguanylate cyclase [Methylophaga sp. OBS4]
MNRQVLRSTTIIVLVALLYILLAKLSQTFAIYPGNISPMWFPSGFIVAMVVIYGNRVWPGIFIGAFIGNVSAYIDFATFNTSFTAVISGTANSIGEVLAAVGSVYLLKRTAHAIDIFKSFHVFWLFLVFCVVLGPLVSAVFGVGSLSLTGILPRHDTLLAFVTWWAGGAVGVLLVAPLILIFFFNAHESRLRDRPIELVLYCLVFALACVFIYRYDTTVFVLHSPLLLTVPLLLWAVLRLGFRVTFISTLIIVSLALWLTNILTQPFGRAETVLFLVELQLFLTVLVSAIFVVGIISLQKKMLLAELEAHYQYDLMTGVYSRAYFSRLLEQENQRFKRYGEHYSLILFDIDLFKQVNDDFGHQKGDEVLIAMAKIIKNELRDIDSLARWGGEEFVILLPNTDIQGAYEIAERCRKTIASTDFGVGRHITISLGVAQATGSSFDDLFRHVDLAMYASKNAGRNTTTTFDDIESTQAVNT